MNDGKKEGSGKQNRRRGGERGGAKRGGTNMGKKEILVLDGGPSRPLPPFNRTDPSEETLKGEPALIAHTWRMSRVWKGWRGEDGERRNWEHILGPFN